MKNDRDFHTHADRSIVDALSESPGGRREPLMLLNVPVRLDATLCDPGEVWLEGPDGKAVRVWPPQPTEVTHGER